jgi:hypothetical protein
VCVTLYVLKQGKYIIDVNIIIFNKGCN